MLSAIYGFEGTELTSSERDFFRDVDPAGFILFKRNCETREQLRALTDSLRQLTGRPDLPILIDQETPQTETSCSPLSKTAFD